MSKDIPSTDDHGLGSLASPNLNRTTSRDMETGSSCGTDASGFLLSGHVADSNLIGTDNSESTMRSMMSQHAETHGQENKNSQAEHDNQQQLCSEDKTERAPGDRREGYRYSKLTLYLRPGSLGVRAMIFRVLCWNATTHIWIHSIRVKTNKFDWNNVLLSWDRTNENRTKCDLLVENYYMHSSAWSNA
jgi:hypothetical protein